jgi:2-dehydropantoate 2-reductase
MSKNSSGSWAPPCSRARKAASPRSSRPQQAAIVAKRLGRFAIGLYARRDYAERRGLPRTVAEIRAHDLIGFDRDDGAARGGAGLGIGVMFELVAARRAFALARPPAAMASIARKDRRTAPVSGVVGRTGSDFRVARSEEGEMRIAVVGAGAIGGTIAGLLARAGGHAVSVLARGPHLTAIRTRGLTLETEAGTTVHRLAASDDPAVLGRQDIVILAAKGHGVPALAPLLAPLLDPRTIVVSAQNGIPWWFFAGLDVPERDGPLPIVDPGGGVWNALSGTRAVGCVIQMPASVPSPGHVHNPGLPRTLIFGTPRKAADPEAIAELSTVLAAAGFDAKPSDDIRTVVWKKLVQNAFFGPVSVLTRMRNGRIVGAPGMPELRARVVDEGVAIAAAWGSSLADAVGALNAPGVGSPHHKTSMLQDFEAGRPVEIGPILAAPIDLARRRGVPVPALETLHTLLALCTAAYDAD